METSLTIFMIALALVSSGCCRTYYYDLPSRPRVQGWKKQSSSTSTILTIGSFLLEKGQSTENERLGVRLVDLTPARHCIGLLSEPSSAKIVLQFYRPSDRRVLCETTESIAGISSSGNLNCPDESELPPSVAIRAYNAKEGWVWLELVSSVGDARW